MKEGDRSKQTKKRKGYLYERGGRPKVLQKERRGEGLLVWTCPAIMALSPAGTAQSALLWWGKRNNVV